MIDGGSEEELHACENASSVSVSRIQSLSLSCGVAVTIQNNPDREEAELDSNLPFDSPNCNTPEEPIGCEPVLNPKPIVLASWWIETLRLECSRLEVEFSMLNPEQSSRFVSKDELGAFIESHRRQLLSYVDRNIGPALRSRLEPEDIFQEVTIAALGSLDQFNAEGRDPFRLLCQLAEQRIIDAHRHHVAAQKRSASREVSIDAPVGSSDGFGFIDLLVASITTASQAFSKDQKEFRLQQAIAELSEEHRDILQMRFVEGMATKEIADRVGKSDGAIRVLLTRTVAHLQEILKIAG